MTNKTTILKFLNLAIFGVLTLTACSSVSVSTKDISTQLLNERTNIVTSNKLSINSIGKLRSAGLDQKTCFSDFDDCLIKLTDSQFVAHSPRQLSLLAELHYARATELKGLKDCHNNSLQCLSQYHAELFKAIKYSYAYLFRYSLTQSESDSYYNLPNELDIQTQDVYNSASNELISILYENGRAAIGFVSTGNVNKQVELSRNTSYETNIKDKLKKPQIRIMTTQVADNVVDIFMPNDPVYLRSVNNSFVIDEKNSTIDSLIPTSSLSMSGLKSISKRAGFGVSYIAQRSGRETQTIRQILSENEKLENKEYEDLATPKSRILQNGNLLMTAVIKPSGNTINQVLASKNFQLNLYNPYRTSTVNILDKNYPLAGNFSASYAMWIAENNFSGVSYLNMLQKNKSLSLPRLFMLEPYDEHKHVIIMVHGLASSPDTWVGVTNDILNDEILRDNFQLWQVAYSTNLPMLENRYYINELIKTAFKQVNNGIQKQGNQHSVLIGHSMGSVISRMLLSNDDLTQELDTLGKYQIDLTDFEQLKLSENLSKAYKEGEISTRFRLEALEPVDTAVFISAPFRGTNFADRWFTKALRDIIQLPIELTLNEDLHALNENPLGSLFLENGATQLSDKSAFIKLTKDISISPNVTYHSIMGNYNSGGFLERINKDTSLQKNSDGIVPYTSSHLEGVASETVLSGGHSIHTNPKTITLLRKILHDHLDKYPTKR